MINSQSDDQMTPLTPGSINGDISPVGIGFNAPLIVISVENMSEKIEKVKNAGGIVVVEPKNVEEMNMIWAIVQDTENNKIGLAQNL